MPSSPTTISSDRSTQMPTSVSGPTPSPRRSARQFVGALIEFAIGQPPPSNSTAIGIGRAPDLLFKELVHATISGIIDRRLVPLDQQLLTFGLGQQRQIADASVRICGRGLPIACEMPGHALDAGFVEQIGAIFDFEIDVVAAIGQTSK